MSSDGHRWKRVLVLVVFALGVFGGTRSALADSGVDMERSGAGSRDPSVSPANANVSFAEQRPGHEVLFTFDDPVSGTETYDLSCTVDGTYVTACSVEYSQITVPPGQYVTVTITTGPVGSGWVRLRAQEGPGGAVDEAQANVTSTAAAGPPVTTPDGDAVQVLAEDSPSTLSFDVQNSGSASGYYALVCSVSGSPSCNVTSPSSPATIAAGQTMAVQVEIVTTTVGTGTVTLMASTDGLSNGGSYAVTVATNAGTLGVTPPAATQQFPNTAGTESVTFSLQNPGTGSGTYDLTCDAQNIAEEIGAVCWFDQDPLVTTKAVVLAGGANVNVSVEFAKEVGFVGTGTLTLSSTLRADPSAQSSGVATVELYDPSNPPVQDPPEIVSGPTSLTINMPATAVETFEVSNPNFAEMVVTYSCAVSGYVASCTLDRSTDTIPGSVTPTAVQATITGQQDGSGTVTFTATGGSGSDTHVVTVTVYGEEGAPDVTPDPGAQDGVVGVQSVLEFDVANLGSGETTYTLTCLPANCGVQASIDDVPAFSSQQVDVTYTPSTVGVTVVTLTATGGGDTDDGTISLTAAAVPSSVEVTPDDAEVSVTPLSVQSQDFTVEWAGSGAATIDMTAQCDGDLTNCGPPVPAQLSLGGANPTSATVSVAYTSGAAGTPADLITVTGEKDDDASQTDNGAVLVTAIPEFTAVVESLRSECPIIAAGAGAIECDDYRFVYPFVPVTRLNRTRNLNLIYNSALAYPHPIIAADVTFPLGQTPVPDSVRAAVWIDNVSVGSVTQPMSALTAGVDNRLSIPLDRYSDVGTQLIDYQVVVSWKTSGAWVDDDPVPSQYISVDRRSEFGRGWWVAGYERLKIIPASDTMIWTGGDGSARLYVKPDPADDFFVAQSRSRPDTIFTVSGGFSRHVLGGGEVRFTTIGVHWKSIDRNGNGTYFNHGTVAGENRLKWVKLATPTGSQNVYWLQWTSSGAQLQGLRVYWGGSNWDEYDINVSSKNGPGNDGYHINSIVTPDGLTTDFEYADSYHGILTGITGPRGVETNLIWESDKVEKVTLQVNGLPDPVFQYAAASLIGSGTTGALLPRPTSAVSAKLDGPRTDVTDVTEFFVTHWGAVSGIRDAEGNETTLTRADDVFEALVTRVDYPNGYKTYASYDPDGFLEYTSDNVASGTTIYSWNKDWSQPTSVTTPEGVVTIFTYDSVNGNRLSQTLGSGAEAITTTYTYNSDGQVDSIIDGESNTTVLAYDGVQGNLESVTTPLGFTTTYTYDKAGRRTTAKSPLGNSKIRTDSTSYDLMGRPVYQVSFSDQDNLELWVENVYNAQTGDRTSVKRWSVPDPNFIGTLTTSWSFDALGRVRAEVATDGQRDSLVYDEAGNVTKTVTRRGHSIDMQYDALNRLTSRATPSVSIVRNVDQFFLNAGYSDAGLVIPSDLTTFEYDVGGNMTWALNGDAWVHRGYDLAGRVVADSLYVRSYDRTDPDAHLYVTRVGYDDDGRRTWLERPSNLSPVQDSIRYAYDPDTGLLDTLRLKTDWVSFDYDLAGRQVETDLRGAITDTRVFDGDGRLTYRTALAGNTNWGVGGSPSSTVMADAITYGPGDRVLTSADLFGNATMEYSGLGHLEQLVRTMKTGYSQDLFGSAEGTVASAACGSTGPWTNECYANDAFGNARTVDRAGFGISSEIALQANRIQEFDNAGRMLSGHAAEVPEQAAFDSTFYDDAGNRSLYRAWGELDDPRFGEDTQYFYDAGNRLRVVDRRTCKISQSNGECTIEHQPASERGVFEEYRYDALGRRVLTYSKANGSLCNASATPNCPNAITRTVWDGDQVLFETRYPTVEYTALVGGISPGETYTVDLERDTGLIDLRTVVPDGLIGGVEDTIPPLAYPFGVTGYVHGRAIDQPLIVERQFTSDELGQLIFFPIMNNGGSIVDAATRSGSPLGVLEMRDGEAQSVEWPGNRQHSGYKVKDQVLATDGPTFWVGGLIDNKRDASGLLYMRNRYYDPQTGQFTQEDPIGIAGGLNLYGYANGDPINFSDPFGLFANCLPACAVPGFGGAGLGKLMGTVLAGGAAGAAAALPFAAPITFMAIALTTEGGQQGSPGFAVSDGSSWASPTELTPTGGFGSLLFSEPSFKNPVSGRSGAEAARDVPSWAKGSRPMVGENGKGFAGRLLDGQYGAGQWTGTGPGSEYSKIKKWGDRGFVDPGRE
jgi:RHS repeat-associated protein